MRVYASRECSQVTRRLRSAQVTLPRSYRFGKYSERAAEPAKGASGGEFGQFLLSVWAAHWLGAWRGARGWINSRELFALRIAGTAIGACAAWTLGRAYDRVVTPESLVTTGPYRFVRHPSTLPIFFYSLADSAVSGHRSPSQYCSYQLGGSTNHGWRARTRSSRLSSATRGGIMRQRRHRDCCLLLYD